MPVRPKLPARCLSEMTLDELCALATALGEPRYRAEQLYRWLYARGASELTEMTNLSKSLRARLARDGYTIGRVAARRVQRSADGTRKIAFELDDGAVIESVLIPMERGRFTQCLSSQVGCALGCTFCYTGTLGLGRNLTAGEIIDQVVRGRAVLPEGGVVDHIVFMGMGEPLHNLDAVLRSLDVICDPEGLGYVHRRVTVSTSGLVPQIARLGRAAPVNLAVSLNATTDALRDEIMPVNRRYPIAALMTALRRYPLPRRRKMTIEYVLLGGLNDTAEDARRLPGLLAGLPARVNLIPWNPFGPGRFRRPEEVRVRAFQRTLIDRGYTVTVRGTKGIDIDAACGQLGARGDASRGAAMPTEQPGLRSSHE